ncbi:hypothetical protein H4Q26_012123 [Puccinia striiformis f. sp. tritici PST-130]|nr:hypothetical protein H4Q26_012123 [Puccinia striiformis f. sp. tritici PST-130]
MKDSVIFNAQLQQVLNLSGGPLDGGLGEPKFLVDGSRFDAPWRRPQNDGPAIRASTMIQYAQHLINRRSKLEKVFEYISTHLYHKDNPNLQIQLDVDHVCRSWSAPSKISSRLSRFHRSLPPEKQPYDREKYLSTLTKMDERLELFWNPEGLPAREGGTPEIPKNSFVSFSKKPHILPTLDRVDGQPKPSQVDTAVFGYQSYQWVESVFPLATSLRPEVFEKLYPINRAKEGTGIAIGRYPLNASSVDDPGPIHPIDRGTDQFTKLLNGMSKWADRFLIDVTFKHFDPSEGRISEQIDRKTGQMRGARELTWSYASFLSALDAREGKIPGN